jgi:transposase-like protein
MERLLIDSRPRRREYSREFKASVLEQTRQSGASISAVALMHNLNPNMVHRWLREERQRQELEQLRHPEHTFVPLQLVSPAAHASPSHATTEMPRNDSEVIRIEVSRQGTSLSVSWPLSAAAQCAQMLRDVLR